MRGHLRTAIDLRKTTVLKVAVAVGTHPSYISNVLWGHINPKPEFCRKVAELLNADQDWLFRDIRRIPPFERPTTNAPVEEENAIHA